MILNKVNKCQELKNMNALICEYNINNNDSIHMSLLFIPKSSVIIIYFNIF